MRGPFLDIRDREPGEPPLSHLVPLAISYTLHPLPYIPYDITPYPLSPILHTLYPNYTLYPMDPFGSLVKTLEIQTEFGGGWASFRLSPRTPQSLLDPPPNAYTP